MPNGISIRVERLSPNYAAVTPTLEFSLKVDSRNMRIEVPPFQYELGFRPDDNVHLYLGRGTAGEKMQSISASGSAQFRSYFELGYEKLAYIDRAMTRDLDSDVRFEIQAYLDYWEDLGSKDNADLRKHGSETISIRDVNVPRSHWIKWLSHWGKDVTMITIPGLLVKQLDELKQKTGALDYDDLIASMVREFRESPAAIENQFICTLPTRRTINEKLTKILQDVEGIKDILLTGYIDGAMIPYLSKSLQTGTSVRIITRPVTRDAGKGVQDAIRQLLRMKAEIRQNKMIHARVVVAGEKHVVVSSADLKTDSLSENREAGVYSADPAIVAAARRFFEEVWNESDELDLEH